MVTKILIVEDEVLMARNIANVLRGAGYKAIIAHTAEDGLRLVYSHKPALALLDVMVPTMGGWELCRQIRTLTDIPVIFLTAMGDIDNVVRGLEMGADDYLVKPVEARELLARIKAHLRRIQHQQQSDKLEFANGELIIDLNRRMVITNEREVELTPREFDLLSVLAADAGKVISTRELVFRAWGMSDDDALSNIKPYIHYLRKKLEVDPAEPRWIKTARGVGYRLNIE